MLSKTVQIQAVIYHNEKKALLRTLDSLAQALLLSRKQQAAIQQAVFIFGDASSSPIFTQEEIQELNDSYPDYLEIQYRFFGFNSGFGKGHNLLAENATSDFLLVINPDILVTPRFFTEMVKPFLDSTLQAGAVEARQTPIEHPKDYDMNTGETLWCSGACVLFPTALYQQVGGYDSDTFFMYCEDVDLSWRIRLTGKKLIYQPKAPVFHSKHLSVSGTWDPTPTEVRCSVESALLMAYKWDNPALLKKLLSTYKRDQNEYVQQGLRDFKQKQEKNLLPQQIKHAQHVAQFVGFAYSKHRFDL